LQGDFEAQPVSGCGGPGRGAEACCLPATDGPEPQKDLDGHLDSRWRRATTMIGKLLKWPRSWSSISSSRHARGPSFGTCRRARSSLASGGHAPASKVSRFMDLTVGARKRAYRANRSIAALPKLHARARTSPKRNALRGDLESVFMFGGAHYPHMGPGAVCWLAYHGDSRFGRAGAPPGKPLFIPS